MTKSIPSKFIFIAFLVFASCFFIFNFNSASAASPVLFFSDLIDGPKSGWEGSAAKGAAVTIWGKNFGATRGSSYVTVGGVNLSNASDYAEWGVTAGNARGMERITFWLNSNMTNGAGTISVVVNGATSNTLPFYVRTTGNIRFVDHNNGNNSNNGTKATDQGAGNGPWRTLVYARQQIGGGDILYIRSGTYSESDSYNSILYLDTTKNGSANNHTAYAGYPAEFPAIDGTVNGTGGTIRNNFRNTGYTVLSKLKLLPYATGIRVQDSDVGHYRIIGIEIDGQSRYPLSQAQTGAIDISCLNYVDIFGVNVHHWGYNKYDHGIYVGTYESTRNVEFYDIGWNEFHHLGTDVSGIYIHPKDTDTTTPKKYADEIDIHDNLTYDLQHAGIHVASRVEDIRIYNNAIYNSGSASGRNSLYFTATNENQVSNIKVFNNVIYSAASNSLFGVGYQSNFASKNNIFYSLNNTSYFTWVSPQGPSPSYSSSYDLWYGNGVPPAWATNALNSNPQLVNAAAYDFHLQSASPAKDAGSSLVSSIVARDYDGNSRPQGSGFDIGAFEYASFNYTKGITNYSYSTQSQPAKNGTYIDSPFNTTVRRLTNYDTDGVPQGAAGLSTGYPTWNPDNYDKRYVLFQIMSSGGGAAGYVVYKTSDWSFYRNLSSVLQGWNGQDAEPRWDTSGLHNDRIYYRKNKQLRYYDVDSQVDGLVHDFANDFTESGFYIYNGEEGSPSSDSRYWAFMYRNGSSPYQATRLIIYDLVTDTLTYKNIASTPNFVAMSPDGNYILASYAWNGSGNEYDGPHTYNKNFSQNWHVGNETLHWGWGYLSDGTLVYVWQDYNDWFSYSELNKSGSVNWIPFFDYSTMTGYPGVHWSLMPSSKKGWIFAIIGSGASGAWSRAQIMAFKLQRNSNTVWRVAFNQDLATSYNHGFGQISRDGLYYYFGADWRQTDNMEVYRVELPTSWHEDLEGIPIISFHPADTNQNNFIEIRELMAFVGKWKSAQATIDDVLTALDRWLGGM